MYARTDDIAKYEQASIKRKRLVEKLKLPMPDPKWGNFWPRSAHSIIERTLRGPGQHVALVLANHTPRDGIIPVKKKSLVDWTGCAKETVTAGLLAAQEQGLLFGERTLGGFLYVWTEKGFNAKDSREKFFMGDGEDIRESPGEGSTDVFARVFLDVNAKLRAGRAEKDKRGCAPDVLREICDVVREYAQEIALDGEEIIDAFSRGAGEIIALWFTREGNSTFKNGVEIKSEWLKRHGHPLDAMPKDLRWCVGELKKRESAKRAKRAEAERRRAEFDGDLPAIRTSFPGRPGFAPVPSLGEIMAKAPDAEQLDEQARDTILDEEQLDEQARDTILDEEQLDEQARDTVLDVEPLDLRAQKLTHREKARAQFERAVAEGLMTPEEFERRFGAQVAA